MNLGIGNPTLDGSAPIRGVLLYFQWFLLPITLVN